MPWGIFANSVELQLFAYHWLPISPQLSGMGQQRKQIKPVGNLG
jgi:hypothetical protein